MIADLIIKYVEEHNADNTLFVLKGFDLSVCGVMSTPIANTISNKFVRFGAIIQAQKKVITYEEFICLREFAMSQFSQIYILENPHFINLFPVRIELDSTIAEKLCAHYDEDAPEDTAIDCLDEYIKIYSNFLKTDQGYACRYSLDDSFLMDQKVNRVFISDSDGKRLSECPANIQKVKILSLREEVDYFCLAYSLESDAGSVVAISIDNAATGKAVLEDKLEMLCGAYPKRLYRFVPEIEHKTRRCPMEVYADLQKYWKYSSFRKIKMYDFSAVEEHKKQIISISQEDIVCDLIEQAENCIEGKMYRDIFVTAPTGAGKSLMFQLPAMYLAEKYNVVTLVITPLIGLMNDQVEGLEKNGYTRAKTINSDISPIVKEQILNSVANGECDILYLSPESLLSRSDVEQLIGKRKIGMLIVDESHIVTTWGKQFRPDYWYLGDHIRKLRKRQSQSEEDPSPFIIATFTATAIYGGNEDMYHETVNSLHMVNPITYLGHIRRDNISIEVTQAEKKSRNEYENDKFNYLIKECNKALIRGQKVLIYFPTVVLVNRFKSYSFAKGLEKYLAIYHGQLRADEKNAGLDQFRSGEKPIMAATKAFGMGIDIPDINIVLHFAPTGNVCDYMQEIGRAARQADIDGHAIYQHVSDDFKHINRLHGLSTIKKYQLVEVIKKILELYVMSRYSNKTRAFTKKRNEMLVDTESFGYIFGGNIEDESDLIAKVKTAMLLIQKDYERKGFSPFYMRPIPIFKYGYFSIQNGQQNRLNKEYPNTAQLVLREKNIFKVDLNGIWDRGFSRSMSFPKFKYLLYTKSAELSFNQKYSLQPAMLIDLTLAENGELVVETILNALHGVFQQSISTGTFLKDAEIIRHIVRTCKPLGFNPYRAQNMISVFFSAVDTFTREYSPYLNGKAYQARSTNTGSTSYQIKAPIQNFFNWIKRVYSEILRTSIADTSESERKLYLINEGSKSPCKEYLTCLGLLEAMGALRFKSLGGSNSQLYIYVNSVKDMEMVRDCPERYKNRLLDMVNKRHRDSVDMMTFLFQNNFSSDEIWDYLENYFLGILPEEIQTPQIIDSSITCDDNTVILQIGDDFKGDYTSWEEAAVLFDDFDVKNFDDEGIPMADYSSAKLYAGITAVDAVLAWQTEKVIISDDKISDELMKIFADNEWTVLRSDHLDFKKLSQLFKG